MQELREMNLLIEGPKMLTRSQTLQCFLCVQEIFGNIFMLHKKYWLEYWIRDTDLTGAGQFLRSVRKDQFGPTEMQFDRKTEVILTRLRTGYVELNAYLLPRVPDLRLDCIVNSTFDPVQRPLAIHCPQKCTLCHEFNQQ